VTDQTGDRVTE